jgi:hypothetical protein
MNEGIGYLDEGSYPYIDLISFLKTENYSIPTIIDVERFINF